jgi:hypothetical protein
MPSRIVKLFIHFQKKAGAKARVDIVRKSYSDPFKDRIIEVSTMIETGPDSGANEAARRLIFETLRGKIRFAESHFYVVAEFHKSEGTAHFKTIVPRTEIPLQFRRL